MIERCGTTTTADGRDIEFSVTQFIGDAVTLESVWGGLEKEQQVHIITEVLEAVRKLHSIKLLDTCVERILEGTGFSSHSTAALIGGPEIGYFTNIEELLRGIIRSHAYLLLDTVTGGVIVQSEYDDMSPVLISCDNLQSLQDSVVLFHQDLEPRNILVNVKKLENGATRYNITAIIDWEMSGVFPFSYEYVYKDLFLGNANLYYTWYTLFKEHGAPLLPMSPLPAFHAQFMEAIELIHYSQDRGSRTMSSLITKKWIAREGVIRQQPAGTNWSKEGDRLQSKRIPDVEMNELVDQILKECDHK